MNYDPSDQGSRDSHSDYLERVHSLPGLAVQSQIKLTGISENFDMSFVTLRFFSILFLRNLKIHKPKAVKNICIQEKFMLWLTFNPGLAFTGFQTTLPCL